MDHSDKGLRLTQMRLDKKYKHKSPRGGEAGFTLIEMIIVVVLLSILGTFIFQILTKSLSAQIAMQKRKERADDAVLVLERISRELRGAKSDSVTIDSSSSYDILEFEKNIATAVDPNRWVRYILFNNDNNLMRQSAESSTGSASPPNVLAENVSSFTVIKVGNGIFLYLEFSGGSDWRTVVFPRN